MGRAHLNGISTVVRSIRPTTTGARSGRCRTAATLRPRHLSRRLDAGRLDGRDQRTPDVAIAEARGTRGRDPARQALHFGTAIPTSFAFTPEAGSSTQLYYTGWRTSFATTSPPIRGRGEQRRDRPVRPIPAGRFAIVFRYSGAGFVPAKIDPRPLTE